MTHEASQPHEKLAAAIRESGLKIRWIADQLDVDPSLVSHWKSGRRDVPHVKARELALLLRRDASDFLPCPECSVGTDQPPRRAA